MVGIRPRDVLATAGLCNDRMRCGSILGSGLCVRRRNGLDGGEMKTYQELEAWCEEKWDTDLDGLDRIDLMWAAYQLAVKDMHEAIERLERPEE